MNTCPGILIVDRDLIAARALEQLLTEQGYSVHVASGIDTAQAALNQQQAQPTQALIGIVIADQDGQSTSRGIDIIDQLHQERPDLVPIMISAFRKVESAVAAMRLGAADYLLKPIVKEELLDAVQRAAQRHLLFVENETKQEEIVVQPSSESPRSGERTQAEGDWHPMPLSEAMKEPERRILLAALESNGWNRGETAKQLDINRTTLYKKIRQHRLDEPA